MRSIFLLSVALALLSVAHAQVLAKVTRQRFFLPMSASFNRCATDANDNFVALGSTGGRAFLTYYDRIGNALWQEVLSLGLEFVNPVDVKFDNLGNVLVLVNGREGDQTTTVVLKLDPDGNELYRNVRQVNSSLAKRLAIDSDGAAIVTGEANVGRMQTYKINPSGGTEWSFVRPDTFPNGAGFDVTTDPNGDVYVAGDQLEGSENHAVVTKLSGQTGGEIFTVMVGSGTEFMTRAKRIFLSSNGFLYFAGESAREAGTFTFELALFGRVSTIGSSLTTQTLDLGVGTEAEVQDLFTDGSSLFVAGNARGVDDRPFIHKASLTLVSSYTARNDRGRYVGVGLSVAQNSLYLVTSNTSSIQQIRTRSYRISDGAVGQEKTVGIGPNVSLSGRSVAQDSRGNLIVVGNGGLSQRFVIGDFEQMGSESRAFRIKLTPNLDVFWSLEQKLFGSMGGHVGGLVADADGNVYVAGTLPARTPTGFVIKVSRTGQVLWRALFNQSANSRDTINDIQIGPDGNLVVVGNTQFLDGNTGTDISVMKISSATGARIWSQVFDGDVSGLDEGRSVAISKGGDVFVAGTSPFNFLRPDMVTFRLAGSSGAPVWVRYYDSPGSGSDEGMDVKLAPNGNVVVVGASGRDATTLVYSNTGRPLWAAFEAGDASDSDIARKSVIGSDNSVFALVELVNTSATGGPLEGYIRYNGSNGAEISRGFIPRANAVFVGVKDIALDRNGNPLVLSGGRDVVVTKFNALTGEQLFNQVFDASGFTTDLAAEIAVDSEGRILALTSPTVGRGLGGVDFALLRLTATGQLARQVKFQNAPGTDLTDTATQLALGLAGDVWAAGTATSSDGGDDIILLRYKQNVSPVAAPDSYGTNEDLPLTVQTGTGVLSNDADPNGDAITAVLVKGLPVGTGTLTLEADGSFVYTPPRNFNGSVSFSYRAVDPFGFRSAVTEAKISVAPVNDPPRAVADSFSVAKGQTLDVLAPGVLGNDTDVDGDAITAQLVAGSLIGGGQLVFRTNGSFTYVAPSQSGTATFDYKAKDAAGLLSVKVKVTITITE